MAEAPEVTAPVRAKPRGQLALFAILLTVAAVPLGLFAMHVFDERSELHDRNLNSLQKASADITDLLFNARVVVESLKDKPEFACELDRRQPFLERVPACPRSVSEPKKHELAGIPVALEIDNGGVVLGLGSEIKFVVRLDKMLAELPARDEIDLLVVARKDGRVEQAYSGRAGLSAAFRSLGALKDPKGEKLVPSLDATLVEQVVLAGESFDLLCQPLELGAWAQSENAQGWAMCGLINSSRATTASLAVTPFIVITLFAVVVFGVLCWPMLKIIFLSSRERFRFADLYFVLFGTWGALMVATIGVLGAQTHFELTAKTEFSNAQTAELLAKRLDQELENLYKQLDHYDALRADEGLHPVHKEDTSELLRADWKYATPESDLQIIFWIDPLTGKQVRKTTVWRDNTPLVYLGDRDYFTSVRDRRLWPSDVAGEGWYVENVRSKTTTTVSTILSTLSSLCTPPANADPRTDELVICGQPFECGEKSTCLATDRAIVAAQARLVSVAEPVLSPGVGFAVIDEHGKAVFHSSGHRVLKDNFFTELPDGDRLRAAVLSGADRHMELNYLGRPHQFFVKPMEQFPWTILVFSDNESKNSVTMETVGHALLLASLFLLINLVGTLLYLAWQGQEVPRWFWPNMGSKAFHATWAGGLVLVGGVFVVCLWLFGGEEQLIVSTALPGLIVVAVLLTSRRKWWSLPKTVSVTYARVCAARRRWWWGALSPRGWYVLASGLLWFNVAVLPSYAFYENALAAAMPEFVRQENIVHGERLDARNCALADYFEAVPAICVVGDDCHCRRGDACDADVYRSPLYDPDPDGLPVNDVPLGAEQVTFLWRWFAQYKPIYNDSVERSRYLYQQADGPWQPNEEGVVEYQHPNAFCGTVEPFSSILPVAKPLVGNALVLIVGFIAFVLGGAWLWYVANTLYFQRIGRQGPLTRRDVMGNDTCVVAFVASAEDRGRLMEDDGSGLTMNVLHRSLSDAELRNFEDHVGGRTRVLLVADASPSAYAYRVPAGFTIKSFPDRAPAREGVGNDFWRRGLDQPVDEDWQANELSCGLAEVRPELERIFADAVQKKTPKREILTQICEVAHEWYDGLWQQCSEDERQVLVQLVQEAVVNPKQAQNVRHLIRRGLIRRDPALRAMSDSFAMWISNGITKDYVAAWEEGAAGMRWSQLRWVVVGVIVLIFGFLWFTQRHVIETGIAFLSVVGVAIPTLLRLLTSVKSIGVRAEP
ncbi:MAG: hypothetical protein JSU95_07285 [Betaproteobacteria bacterium]|nr:MAG: hypothetical protein JSU95_07285 [Betaproteobacteria bacterium]